MPEPSRLTPDQLAEKVRPWIASPYPGDFHGAGEAVEALSELVIRAQGHVPVEALAASEVAREQAEKERDEWKAEAEHLQSALRLANKNTERRGADRDRLAAALDKIANRRFTGFGSGTRADLQKVAREALNPGDGDD